MASNAKPRALVKRGVSVIDQLGSSRINTTSLRDFQRDRAPTRAIADVRVAFKRRKARSPLARVRCAQLNRFFHDRWGPTWPDDDAGRDDLFIMLHHLQWRGVNGFGLVCWIRTTCPWMPEEEAENLIRRVHNHPRKWSASTLGERIGLTDASRTRLRITSISPCDVSRAERLERSRRRKAACRKAARRAAGVQPRAQYEAESLSRSRPWEALNVSRRTWERAGGSRRSPDVASLTPRMLSLSYGRASELRQGLNAEVAGGRSAPCSPSLRSGAVSHRASHDLSAVESWK